MRELYFDAIKRVFAKCKTNYCTFESTSYCREEDMPMFENSDLYISQVIIDNDLLTFGLEKNGCLFLETKNLYQLSEEFIAYLYSNIYNYMIGDSEMDEDEFLEQD